MQIGIPIVVGAAAGPLGASGIFWASAGLLTGAAAVGGHCPQQPGYPDGRSPAPTGSGGAGGAQDCGHLALAEAVGVG